MSILTFLGQHRAVAYLLMLALSIGNAAYSAWEPADPRRRALDSVNRWIEKKRRARG